MGFFDRLNSGGNIDADERDSLFDSGLETDASDTYANKNKLFIEFYHLPSGKSVAFKGFITEWSDKFDSKYNTEEVYGRNDPVHTFQGTSREISVSWDVPAASAKEAQENLARVSVLAQFLYPSYNMDEYDFGVAGASSTQKLKVGTMAKAPLVKVRFANLIIDSKGGNVTAPSAKNGGLICAMSGLTVTADFDAGVIDATGIATPKAFKLSTNLKVLHQHTLGWDTETNTWLGNGEGNAAAFPYNAWSGPSSGEQSNHLGLEASRSGMPGNAPSAPPPSGAGPPGTGGSGTGTP